MIGELSLLHESHSYILELWQKLWNKRESIDGILVSQLLPQPNMINGEKSRCVYAKVISSHSFTIYCIITVTKIVPQNSWCWKKLSIIVVSIDFFVVVVTIDKWDLKK